MNKFKKWDRVEFSHKGDTIFGTVLRGGPKIKVMQDGADHAYNISPNLLKLSTKPVPMDEPHPMDIWEVAKYSESPVLSEETIAFSSDVLCNNIPVISASNTGRGGCNRYFPLSGGFAQISQLETDAKQWMVDHGMPEEGANEAADFWLNWKATLAPYGRTAKQHIDEWKKALSPEMDNSVFSM